MGRNTSFFVTIQILLGLNNTHFYSRIKLHANESETEEIKRKHTHIPFARHQPLCGNFFFKVKIVYNKLIHTSQGLQLHGINMNCLCLNFLINTKLCKYIEETPVFRVKEIPWTHDKFDTFHTHNDWRTI